jgi:hypothetical protein
VLVLVLSLAVLVIVFDVSIIALDSATTSLVKQKKRFSLGEMGSISK